MSLPGDRATVSVDRWGPALLLLLSLAAIAVAPLAMPASYDWIDHTTSESAAQGVGNAWIARIGFLLWGLAALWLALRRAIAPGLLGRALIGIFGLSMVGAALFPTRPWDPATAFDRSEDMLHTIFGSAMGMAFILLVAVRVGRKAFARRPAPLDTASFTVASIASLIMAVRPDVAGAAQRMMFLIAYVWFLRLTLREGSEVSGDGVMEHRRS